MPSLIAATGDYTANPSAPQVVAYAAIAVAFVAHDAVRPQPRAPALAALDHTPLHQGGYVAAVRFLAAAQDKGERAATSLGAHMELGAEPAATAAERFLRGVPPFAPAAC